MGEKKLNSKVILVVDDEADLREIVASELEFMGAQVFTAENVIRARKILDENHIDLVISDIRMPGGTGIDLLQHIKTNYSALLPVMLITGFADITNEGAYALGAEALIHKPFKLDELLQTAEKLCLSPMERFEKNFQHTAHSIKSVNHLTLGRGGITVEIVDRTRTFEVGQYVDIDIPTLRANGVIRWIKGNSENGTSIWLGIEILSIEEQASSLIEDKIVNKTLPFIPSANSL